jgi:transposase
MPVWQVIQFYPVPFELDIYYSLILNDMAKEQKKSERAKKERQQIGRTYQTTQATLERINLKVAGIDVGSEKHFVAVLDQPVKCFLSFTQDISDMIQYLKTHGIEAVVMEATGIYWLFLYEMLENAKFKVCLVNGAHSKNVPGRKTDVLDSDWLRELHTYGLLRASFIPDEDIRLLRYYVRLRDDHISMAASHINHIQKNMDAMNLKLHKVISNIMGKSGLKVVRAILSGERNAENLMGLCSSEIINNKKTEVLKSLEGNYRLEYLFGLKQALELWEYYRQKERECDKEIESVLHTITCNAPTPEKLSKPKQIRSNKPEIEDFHLLMTKLTGGKDATAIAGINDYSLLKIISEVGTDLTKFKDSKHFTSWLGVTPGLNQSGKSNRKKRRKVNNRAGQAFRQMAVNVGNGKNSALSGFYKRIRSRSGGKTAVKATARKIAVYYYNLMTKGLPFVEEGIKRYEERYKSQQKRYLEKKAKEFGLILIAA